MRYGGLLMTFILSFAGCAKQESVSRAHPEAEQEPAAITTGKLLNDMIDLHRLVEMPHPAYTTKQFSSYDRASKSPTENWFANGDAGQYIRVDEKDGRKEFVMMDVDGRGAIVRIWSANPAGTLRVYLDANEAPAIEAPMTDLLDSKYPGLPKPISGKYSEGWNLYFPIPYTTHCKVTSDNGSFYYHVNYRTYPAGTAVTSFTLQDLKDNADQIADVAHRLSEPREGAAPPASRQKSLFDILLAPDESAKLADINGTKAICGFLIHIAAQNVPAAARGTVLSMTFDGEQTVECPLGDFFGTAPGLIPYASLPLGITEGERPDLWCHWWMPFKKGAQIAIKNLGDQKVRIEGAIATVPHPWTNQTMLFHAKWRIQRDLPARPMTDWTHLQTTGTGRFVGGALHIVNSVRDWWGEGDEKIYVDSEKFPSHFGTGSEDYYGYAWCCPVRFTHAYHNQPACQGPGNYGNTSVNRFHIIDDIPFTTQFKFDIENWHGSDKPGAKTTRAAITYWYERPGGTDFFKPITRADVKLLDVPPYQVSRVPGAIEGETLKVLEKTGTVDTQELGEAFSNDKHLWWRDNQPGNKLVLAFDAPSDGPKHVIVRLTKAQDYAKVQLSINGKKAGDPIDLFNNGVVTTGEIDLGAFDLKTGQNTLTVEIVGANDKAVKAYMFGLDYIRLVATGSATPGAGKITTEILLNDMTNLERLTRFPDPAYTAKQFSSYDRASVSPSDHDKWFANADAGKFLRVETNDSRKESVMADTDGPGVITRIWSANPEGVIRIYLDGSEKPVIETPMKDLLGGNYPGLPRPIAGEYARGWNLYFPIPYAKHCKITCNKPNGLYYHVGYRTYPAGTDIATFAVDDVKKSAKKIDQIVERFNAPEKYEPPADAIHGEFMEDLQPGAEKRLLKINGTKAISRLWAVLEAKNMPAAARGLVLSISFDGEDAVESPIGDFFGTALDLNPYASLPLVVTDKKAMMSYWVMPFTKTAIINIKNHTDQKVHLHGAAAIVPYQWDDRSLLFHAKWRTQELPTRPFIDWTHLDCTGKGRFVGGALTILSPAKQWWGEGDEKIYVDGEKFPSHFGTGSEDYYGYAWGSGERFVHAYHNQPRCDGPGSYGNTSVNRFHILDDIPFTTQFKFDMENWHWNDKIKVSRDAVSYWYARPGGKDAFKPVTADDVKYKPVPPYVIEYVAGAIEGETMKELNKSAGEVKTQKLDDRFSGELGLRWNATKVGDTLTLGFNAPAEGGKHVIVHMAKSNEGGTVQVSINGKKAGEPIDLFNPRVKPTGAIDLGTFDLTTGPNKLTVEIVGSNEKSKKYAFGLDYILLK